MLERAAVSSSRGPSNPGTEPAPLASLHLQAGSLLLSRLGSPDFILGLANAILCAF